MKGTLSRLALQSHRPGLTSCNQHLSAPASFCHLQGKPSTKTPRKRRYFQLSQDGSTLRWSWNKYILLYYVEVRAQHDAVLSGWTLLQVMVLLRPQHG